jgi:hypothetical protein
MPKEEQERHHGSLQLINAEAAANYLEMDVKTLQRKTREKKILGYTPDDGSRHHWFYYLPDLDDYRHKYCSKPKK